MKEVKCTMETKKYSEDEIDFIMGNCVASLSFEGITGSPVVVEVAKKVLRGELALENFKEAIAAEKENTKL